MIDWQQIQTILLDMDGTLLDLHYDNHFWQHHVPARFAEKHALTLEASQRELGARYAQVAGSMQWYCVDYWSRELALDIARLKQEVAHLIAVHPHVEIFLQRARDSGKRVVLVTNAHHKSLALKMERTGLQRYFDQLISAHSLGLPKEHAEFWSKLQDWEKFDPNSTLLIDDSLPVLRSAQAYGIAHLLAIYQPDTRQARKDVAEFRAIEQFDQLLAGL